MGLVVLETESRDLWLVLFRIERTTVSSSSRRKEVNLFYLKSKKSYCGSIERLNSG